MTANGGLLNVLKTGCGISQSFDPTSGGSPPEVKQFEAIWDTGATNSGISQAVVDACGLVPTGRAQVFHANGEDRTNTYLVNVYLPNNVAFPNLRVLQGIYTGADILIGMDIIGAGDFAVTNRGGITVFSYRYPSEVHIDFVAEQAKRNALAAIPQHGSGKRSKGKRK